jgi:hypothetical protein
MGTKGLNVFERRGYTFVQNEPFHASVVYVFYIEVLQRRLEVGEVIVGFFSREAWVKTNKKYAYATGWGVWSGPAVFVCFSVPVGSRGTEPS